jgi:hypothetical protein
MPDVPAGHGVSAAAGLNSRDRHPTAATPDDNEGWNSTPGWEARRTGHQRKGTEKMRRTLLVGILLVAGCQSVAGPFAPRRPERVDDPRLPIPEQEARGRDRYALPEDDRTVAPRTYMDRPGTHGR